jgi:septal ring-binding cell division protein DamX
MAKPKNDWKQLVSAGALVVAVVATLIIGWALQGEPAEDDDAAVVELAAPDHMPDSSGAADIELDPEPTAAPPPAPPEQEPAPEPQTLRSRSARDHDRLSAAADEWTLQFITACDEGNVRAKLDELHGHDDFYLVPVTLDGRSCYRLCWGRFETRERALAARNIPSSLAAITDKPLAIPAGKVVR